MFPRRMRPIRLSRRLEPFDSDQFIFELKIDGFRALAHIEAGEGKLISRNGNTFRGFADLATWIAEHLRVESAILDGEIACVDECAALFTGFESFVWPEEFSPDRYSRSRRITTPSLTGLRNRAVRKRTRMLLKEEFPNGVVTELTTVGTRGCLFRDGERRIARCAQYVSVAWHG